MRLFIDYKLNETGKGKFLSRLIPELEALGVVCKFDHHKADLSLSISRFENAKGGIPRVVRIDNIDVRNNARAKWANGFVRGSIKMADAVIYQSNFAQRWIHGLLHIENKREYIIYNGANPKDYENVVPIQSEFKKNVIMSAKWFSKRERIDKRLSQAIAILKEYNRPDTCFWICGQHRITDLMNPRIRLMGHLPEMELRRYLKLADLMLNFSYWDACPNSVVEALCARVPVICAKGDGTEELVAGGYGEAMDFADPYEIGVKVKTNPSALKKDTVMEGIDRWLENPKKIELNPNVLIQNTARAYKAVFEKVLK